MKKRLTFLLLALILVCSFALVACDGDEPAPASSSSSTPASSSSSTPDETSSSSSTDSIHQISYAYKDADGNDVVVMTARVLHGRKATLPSSNALGNDALMEGKVFVEWILPEDAQDLENITVLNDMTIYFEVRDLQVFTVSIGIPKKYADFYAPKYPNATKDDDGNLIIDSHEVYEGETFDAKTGLPKNLMIDEYTYYDETAGEWCGFYFNYAWTNEAALSGINSDVVILADINDVEGVVPYVENAPTIDGVRDASYGTATYKLVKSYITGTMVNSLPDYDWQYLDATYSLCWSGEYIYVFVEVKDPSLNMSYDAAYADYVSTQDNPWLNDAVEMWFSLGQLRSGMTYDEATNTYSKDGVVCTNANQYIFSKQCVDSLATKLYCGLGEDRTPTYFPASRDDENLRAAKRTLNEGEEDGGKGVYTVEFVIRARHDATEAEKVDGNEDPLNKDAMNKVYLGKKLDAGNVVFFGLQISDAYRTQGAQDRAKFLAFGTQSQAENAGAYKVTVRNETFAIVPGTPVGALEGDGYQIYRMVLGGAAPAAN